MRRNVIGTVLITLLIVGALGAIGFGLWQMGYQRGLVETGTEVVTRTVNGIQGWWGPGWGFGGFGFFGLFFKVLLFFLLFGLIARFFFGPRRWGGPGPYWGRGGHEGQGSPVEQHMTEWHDRAHGNPPNPKPEPEQDT